MSVAFSNLPAGVVRAGEGERHGVIGHTIIFKSLGKELGGAAFAWETQSPPGTMVPPHTHSVEDELIYVVEGQLEATVGDQAYTLRAGDLVKMPRGVPHGIRMAENQSTKTLWTVVPAGKMEGLFQALGTLPANQPPDLVQITRIFSDHDIELLPPPAAYSLECVSTSWRPNNSAAERWMMCWRSPCGSRCTPGDSGMCRESTW